MLNINNVLDLEKAHEEEDEDDDDEDDDEEEEEELNEPYHISYHNQGYDFDEPPMPVIPSPTIQTALALKSHPQLENSDLNQFRIESIETHNDYRSRHDVQPLMHSDELSIYAQYWAEYVKNNFKKKRFNHI